MKTKVYLSLALLLFVTIGCTSVEKLMSKGNYDSAIAFSLNKIKGKKKKSPKYVIALEESFKMALNQDFDRINRLKSSNDIDADLQILRIYEKIDRYQSSIRPLLPIKDKHGYVADISLVNLAEQKSDYANKAADYLYDSAINNLQNARNGSKQSAKDAYNEFQQLEGISGTGNSNISKLRDEAKELGTTFVLLDRFVSKKNSLSGVLTDQFLNDGFAGIGTTWIDVQLNPERRNYDLKASFILEDFKISPEKESSREYKEKKEVQEETGAKDRDGKIITRKKEVVADVIELYQFKEAIVMGTVVIVDNNTRREVYSQKLDSKMLFENYASTYKGDKRALSDVSLKRIGGKPMRFPSNDQILGDAIDILKKDMVNSLKKGYSKY